MSQRQNPRKRLSAEERGLVVSQREQEAALGQSDPYDQPEDIRTPWRSPLILAEALLNMGTIVMIPHRNLATKDVTSAYESSRIFGRPV
jgi:hypothetical protein